jgi:hypothetical protein
MKPQVTSPSVSSLYFRMFLIKIECIYRLSCPHYKNKILKKANNNGVNEILC